METKNYSLDRHLFPVGVNIFVIRDGKLLLGRRKDASGYHDGEWGIPGGHLEGGERMVDAAARELEEETGMRATSFEFFNADNDVRQDGFHYVHFGFIANGLTGEPETREPDRCYGWEWFPVDQLPEPLFVGHRKLIRAFLEKKSFVE